MDMLSGNTGLGMVILELTAHTAAFISLSLSHEPVVNSLLTWDVGLE